MEEIARYKKIKFAKSTKFLKIKWKKIWGDIIIVKNKCQSIILKIVKSKEIIMGIVKKFIN